MLREDLGDWGYGLTVPVADTVDGWVRLTDAGGEMDFWIAPGREAGLQIVDRYGLPGRLWRLGPVRAISGQGEEVTLERATFFILDVTGGNVRLRGEVPADMPCGHPPAGEPQAVPTYMLPLERLLGPDGRLDVEPAYTRGC
jgi:hypothetical protein